MDLIKLVMLLSICFNATALSANDFDYRISHMQALVKFYEEKKHFTGVVLVAVKGEVFFSTAVGFANREHFIKNTLTTKFRLGSISKQFTAAAILLLKEEGRLVLNEPISRYLPGYPEGDIITIHHLLTHTAGIPNYTDFADFDWSKPRSLPELVDLFKDKSLSFAPGSDWSYSNSGYVLLALIIEKVSGHTYEDFLYENIFKPAGLLATTTDDPRRIIAERAQGYDAFSGYIQNASYIESSVTKGAGNILSSTRDLLRWDQVLYESSILSEESKKELFTAYVPNGYSYGWVIDHAFGHKRMHHGGAIAGFLTEFARYPEDQVTIITLANTIFDEPNSDLADGLASLYFHKKSQDFTSKIAHKDKFPFN